MSATGRGAPGDYHALGAYQTDVEDCHGLARLLPFLDRPQVILEPHVGEGNWIRAIETEEARRGVRHQVGAMDLDGRAPGLMLARARGGFALTGDFLTTTPAIRPTAILGNPPFAIPQAPVVCPRCGGRKVLTPSIRPRSRVADAMALQSGDLRVASARKPCTKCGSAKRKPTGTYQPPPIPCAEKHIRRALSMVPANGGHVAFVLRMAILESEDRIPFWKEWGPGHGLRTVYALARRLSFTGGSTDATSYGFFHWERGYTGPAEIVTVDHRVLA